MSFIDSVNTCFRKYFTFSGRAGRSEYWQFWLFWLIIMVALTVVNSVLFGPTVEVERQLIIAQDGTETTEKLQKVSYDSGLLGDLFMLAVFVPGIAVASRRLHDIGRSGWWQLMPIATLFVIVALVFLATLGWGGTMEAMSETGNVKLELGAVGIVSVIVTFAAFLTLLFWLCKESQPGPNKYGPNPNEVSQ